MTWPERSKPVLVGDRVYYSGTCLKSASQVEGEVPFARGVVTRISSLGEVAIAEVAWDQPAVPQRLIVGLRRAGLPASSQNATGRGVGVSAAHGVRDRI